MTAPVTPATLHVGVAGDIRVRMGSFAWSPREARDIARAILDAAEDAERLPERHDRHVNLVASCALCRHEAGAQIDRLDWSR